MIKIEPNKKQWKSIKNYLLKIDRRVTAFYRGMSTHAARMAAIELNEQIKLGKNPLTAEYRDGVRALRVANAAIIPKEEKSLKKQLTTISEEHWACIAIRSNVKTGEALAQEKDRVIITVRPHKRQLARSPKYIWPLVRYGPWTLDSIPFVPSSEDALVLYKKVTQEEVGKIQQKNDKDLKKVYYLLKLAGTAVQKRENVVKDLKAVDEVEYYALRREFGLITGEKPVWRPTIRRVKSWGMNYLFTTNKQLWRALFDPHYSGYGMLGRFTEIDKEEVKTFESFQDKVR